MRRTMNIRLQGLPYCGVTPATAQAGPYASDAAEGADVTGSQFLEPDSNKFPEPYPQPGERRGDTVHCKAVLDARRTWA